jgi:hypothetical protein
MHFPPDPATLRPKEPKISDHLTPVSSCPHCGAPVYGKKFLMQAEEPIVQFTCTCRFSQGPKVDPVVEDPVPVYEWAGHAD